MRTDDGSIIYECLNGEPGAFGVLVDKYKEGIYAFVYSKLRNFQDAQDVTQEVFLQAYRGLRSLRRWESFGFWLYRIAYARCSQWLRINSKRVDREFIEDQDSSVIDDGSLGFYRDSQLSQSLQEALDSLPEMHREVLMLRYFAGMNSKEIARVIGTSPGAIRMRLSRARAQLREEMADMMDTAFEGQRIPAGFTLRIVEAVKRIKIHPMPRATALPWGLSVAVGIIITVMSFNPQMSIPGDIAIPTGSPLPAETKVLKTGEIPVDILKTSEISVIASKQGNGDGGDLQLRNWQNVFLAPHHEVGTWEGKADMPIPRQALSTTAVNGKIYAIGGVRNGWQALSTVEEYDPVTDRWTTKANMPTPRFFLATCATNGKIYAMGGYGNGWKFLQAVEEYDPATDTWSKKGDMPELKVVFSTIAVNEKIYVIGGVSGALITLARVEEYDPVADKWAKRADMPTARRAPATIAMDGKIYVIGGAFFEVKNGRNQLTLLPAVEVYDPATDTWSKKSDMPDVQESMRAAGSVSGKVYIFGGIGGVEDTIIWNQRYNPVKTVRSYDPETDTWQKEADMPSARGGASASVVNGKIYVIGGVPDWTNYPGGAVTLPTVEEYTPEDLSISPQGKLPTKWGEVKSD